MGKQQCWLYFSGLPNHCKWWLKPKIQRHLLLGRKLMTNLDSKLKNRDINLWKNVHLVKAMVFPVVMYGCESWAIKKAECWRLMLFNSVVESPLDCKEMQPNILKEISPGCLLEGLMLKLRLQYFGHVMWIIDSFEKTLMLGKIEDRRSRGTENEMVRWHHQHNGLRFWWPLRFGEVWRAAVHGVAKSRTRLIKWNQTELKWPRRINKMLYGCHYITYIYVYIYTHMYVFLKKINEKNTEDLQFAETESILTQSWVYI